MQERIKESLTTNNQEINVAKTNFIITAPASVVFGGSRRNGAPVKLPITRAEVARELLAARKHGWSIKKVAGGYMMTDTGITYTGVAA